MSTTRRDFLDRLATGAVALGGIPLVGSVANAAAVSSDALPQQGTWDVSWPKRLKGRVKTVVDVPEIESGLGVWRAHIWAQQYAAAVGVPPAQISTALVLRHNAIVLAMKQEFWERYGLGESSKATHPLTGAPTSHNPALLGADQGVPEPYSNFTLTKFLANGGVALACDLALQFEIMPIVAQKDGVSPEVARERAVGGLIPGVILQPSGVFAAVHAQQAAQANYFRSN